MLKMRRIRRAIIAFWPQLMYYFCTEDTCYTIDYIFIGPFILCKFGSLCIHINPRP